MENIQKELVIVGAGPAGLSAAIYGKRAMFDEVVIETYPYCGGQMKYAGRIDNYPGFYGIQGMELAEKFRKHAENLEIPMIEHTVEQIQRKGEGFCVLLDQGVHIFSKAVIFATGSTYRKLGIKGEQEFTGHGVSYCASCDGTFFKGKDAAVIGGGNVALWDAIYLSAVCRKVYLVHRRDEFRAERKLVEEMKRKENIVFLPHYEVEEISGDECVEQIHLIHNQTGKGRWIPVSGVFAAIGMEAESHLVREIAKVDSNGYLIAGEDCRTSVRGLYAAGDVRKKTTRQIVTATADGACAIHSLKEDLSR